MMEKNKLEIFSSKLIVLLALVFNIRGQQANGAIGEIKNQCLLHYNKQSKNTLNATEIVNRYFPLLTVQTHSLSNIVNVVLQDSQTLQQRISELATNQHSEETTEQIVEKLQPLAKIYKEANNLFPDNKLSTKGPGLFNRVFGKDKRKEAVIVRLKEANKTTEALKKIIIETSDQINSESIGLIKLLEEIKAEKAKLTQIIDLIEAKFVDEKMPEYQTTHIRIHFLGFIVGAMGGFNTSERIIESKLASLQKNMSLMQSALVEVSEYQNFITLLAMNPDFRQRWKSEVENETSYTISREEIEAKTKEIKKNAITEDDFESKMYQYLFQIVENISPEDFLSQAKKIKTLKMTDMVIGRLIELKIKSYSIDDTLNVIKLHTDQAVKDKWIEEYYRKRMHPSMKEFYPGQEIFPSDLLKLVKAMSFYKNSDRLILNYLSHAVINSVNLSGQFMPAKKTLFNELSTEEKNKNSHFKN